MSVKLIDVGLICMRNEEEDIVGWAKESLFFCKKVVAIIDPETSDNTEQILRDRFPSIIIEYQDRNLGDSDDGNEGMDRNMICHINYTYGLKRHVKPGEWIMELAPDERLIPSEFNLILEDIKNAKKNNYDGLVFPNYFTPRGDLNHVIDWYDHFYWGNLRQIKFWEYKEGYVKNKHPHSDQKKFCVNFSDTGAGFYHFCYVKNSRVPFGGWRDNLKYKTLPMIERENPFKDWREMPELNDQGELID